MQILESPAPATTAKFVRVEDGIENVYELPIEKHFNDGSGVIFYVNKGFVPFDEFQAKKHAEQVKAQQEAETKDAKKKEGK